MVDEPSGEQKQPEGDHGLPRSIALNPIPQATDPSEAQQQARNQHQGAKYVVRALVAVGRGCASVIAVGWRWLDTAVGWIDARHGTMTALATVAIAILTYQYVRYSQRQWSVMSDQVAILHVVEGAHLATGKFQGDIAQGAIRIPIENYGRIPSRNTRTTVRIVMGLPLMTNRTTHKFGGEHAGVAPGSGEGTRAVLYVPLGFEPGDLDAIRSGKTPLFIAGVIQYENGLGKEDAYPFSFRYALAHLPFPLDTLREDWVLCEDLLTPLLHAFDPAKP